MAKKNTLTAVDLGTEKTTVLIAAIDPESKQELQVLGVSVVPTQGMKKSQIVNLEKVIESLTKALDAAERMAGMQTSSAVVSISGPQINSHNSKGVVAVASPNQEIVASDVERVIEAARAVSIPPGKEILHVIPKDFAVDSQAGIKDALGMTGIRLESETHLITASNTTLRNTEKCLNDVGLKVDSFVFSALAATESSLSETEKELGVVLVDIGAGSTAICAYVDGSLSYSSTLPIGAKHITQDIALGCRISLDAAEKIKIALSKETPKAVIPKAGESKESLRKRRTKANELQLKELGIDEGVDKLSKKTIIEGIMAPRMKEIFKLVEKELVAAKIIDQVPAGIVITGGGAETVAIAEVAKRSLGLPAHIGQPVSLRGVTHDLQGPEFATSIGLLLYAKNQNIQIANESAFRFSANILKKLPLNNFGAKLISIFKSFLP
ncbi:MAG: cell division protein FtsA [Patescibacteria group bacterium]